MALASLALTQACTPEPVPRDQIPFDPDYRGAEAEALDAEIVRIGVEMGGARDPQDILDYADCAIAGYADARGFGFARFLRSDVQETSGIWRADAFYTMSPALPEGSRKIDVGAQRDACAALGIPQV